MTPSTKSVFPKSLLWFAAFLFLASGCQRYSEYFGKVEPPEGNVFRFNNGAEPEYLDPALMSGQPDGRIARLLFEGLTVNDPQSLQPMPGAAERWEISPDQVTYTFYLRKEAVWSDGRPVTAHDFVYSWTRALDPETASSYANILYYIENAERYNQGQLEDPSQLGLRALDGYTLQVKLQQPTPFFMYLTSFYTYMPVPEHVVEKHGPRWTAPDQVVGNGPFLLVEHRANAKMEFVPNPRYWDADSVRLERVIAYAVDDLHTSANMYESGMIDWVPSGYFPAEYVTYMRGRFQDLETTPFLTIYYYSLNTTRPALNNRLVRQALAMALDRQAITDDLLRGGQIPTAHFVPVGFDDYQSPPGPEYDPEQAARLLAEAGYPNGEDFPVLNILFNSLESHKKIAEAIQQMWAENLNIQVTVRNEEWASYLKSMDNMDYDIARRGWIADYPDPSTFTDLMEGDNGNNSTGWKNSLYDSFLRLARLEIDPSRRMHVLQQAEAVLLEDLPVLPIYTYVSNSLIKPYVRGLYPTLLDTHPLNHVWIDHNWQQETVSQAGNGD